MPQPPDRLLASYHEAGHMWACIYFKIVFTDGSIDPSWFFDSTSGLVRLPRDVKDPWQDLVMSLAGPEAERIFRVRNEMGDPDEARWEGDLGYAHEAVVKGNGAFTFNQGRSAAHKLCQDNWPRITSMGQLLDQKKRLSAARAKRAAKV